MGKQFELRRWQKAFIFECYELRPNGDRRYKRAGLGLPKGNGKTELAAALALAELLGPVEFAGWASPGVPAKGKRRTAPDIPIGAASYEQANTLFGAARTMVEEGPLDELCECFDTEITVKGKRVGRLYRVAAAAGSNDGRRPSCFIADELHEWEGKKERVHLVLSNGRAKRKNAWELWISTAGWNPDSLLGRICAHGEKVNAGKEKDAGLLFRWYRPDPKNEYDLDDPKQLEAAIREANPAAGDFLPFENILAKYAEIPEHEFRRYYLNEWTTVPEQWMSDEIWTRASRPEIEVEAGTAVTLGFDGSYNRDSTAVTGCTLDVPRHLFTLGIWERPVGVKEWRIDQEEVMGVLEDAIAEYDVRGVAADDTFGRIWANHLEALAEKGVVVIDWPTRSPSRMSPACAQFWGAIQDGDITHDGDEELGRHIANCRTKTDRYGPRVVKEHSTSEKKIDGAVAGIIAYDTALRNEGPGTSVYEERGLTVL
jgi:phage terminase large subunit-like protein